MRTRNTLSVRTGIFLLLVIGAAALFISCGGDDDDNGPAGDQGTDDDTGDDDIADDAADDAADDFADDDSTDDTSTDDSTDDDTSDDDTADDDTSDDTSDDTADDTADDDTEPNTYWPSRDLFDAVLATLRADYWDDSGNWTEDMMHDATTFAPEVLLMYGHEAGDIDLIAKGEQTCRWELDLLGQVPDLDPDVLYMAGAGAMAIWWGARYDVDPMFGLLAATLLPVADVLAETYYDQIGLYFFGPATALGFVAHINNEIARYYASGGVFDWITGHSANLADLTYANFFDPGTGLFDDGSLLSSGTMLTAVAEYASLAGDADRLADAEALFDAIDSQLWDPVEGGYWDSPTANQKYLSDNLMTLRGTSSLYEATGNASYRLRAEEHLAWIEDTLFSDGLCYHHWTEGVGRADYFCTGCNFLLLDDIYHLHSVGLIDGKQFQRPRMNRSGDVAREADLARMMGLGGFTKEQRDLARRVAAIAGALAH